MSLFIKIRSVKNKIQLIFGELFYFIAKFKNVKNNKLNTDLFIFYFSFSRISFNSLVSELCKQFSFFPLKLI